MSHIDEKNHEEEKKLDQCKNHLLRLKWGEKGEDEVIFGKKNWPKSTSSLKKMEERTYRERKVEPTC